MILCISNRVDDDDEDDDKCCFLVKRVCYRGSYFP